MEGAATECRPYNCMIVRIERILPGGVGLGHADGKTVFVSLAVQGDLVRVKVDREQGNLLFASIEEVVEPSSQRIEPPCPYFGRCGGCDFQQMNYEEQLRAKSDIVRDCLHRIARIEVPDLKIIGSPNEWHYRARATWQRDPELQTIGYYERGSRNVCDVAECAVLVPGLQSALEAVRVTPADQFPDELKHLDAVVGDSGVSMSPEFAAFDTRELSLGIREESYSFNALAFFQVNQGILDPLLEFALGDVSGNSALDLYCGVGLFTLPLARKSRSVTGVESSTVATRFARRNVQLANLTNVSIVTSTVTEWIRSNAKKLGHVDFVLLDPPRAGAESAVIKGIVDLKPLKIVYVSCDPATLARDLKKLLASGFQFESIRAFDMFPQTHHVETVVHLKK